MSATRKKGTTCLRLVGELALALANQLLDVSQSRAGLFGQLVMMVPCSHW
jgi:hypothetical protein